MYPTTKYNTFSPYFHISILVYIDVGKPKTRDQIEYESNFESVHSPSRMISPTNQPPKVPGTEVK